MSVSACGLLANCLPAVFCRKYVHPFVTGRCKLPAIPVQVHLLDHNQQLVEAKEREWPVAALEPHRGALWVRLRWL